MKVNFFPNKVSFLVSLYLGEEPGSVPPDLPEVEDLGPEADDERGAGQHDRVVRRHQADRPLRAQRLK